MHSVCSSSIGTQAWPESSGNWEKGGTSVQNGIRNWFTRMPCRVDAWYRGLQPVVDDDVAGGVEIDHTMHQGRVRLQTDEDEHARRWVGARRAITSEL